MKREVLAEHCVVVVEEHTYPWTLLTLRHNPTGLLTMGHAKYSTDDMTTVKTLKKWKYKLQNYMDELSDIVMSKSLSDNDLTHAIQLLAKCAWAIAHAQHRIEKLHYCPERGKTIAFGRALKKMEREVALNR